MVFSLRLWLSILSASCYFPYVNAAPVDVNAILAQLRKSGGCVSIPLLHVFPKSI